MAKFRSLALWAYVYVDQEPGKFFSSLLGCKSLNEANIKTET